MSTAPAPNRWQVFLSRIFPVAVALMATQYAVVLYGPAKVIIAPVNFASPDSIAAEPWPKDKGSDEAPTPGQQPGIYVIGWETFDQVAYKLDEGRFLPPAEGLVALLCVAAMPLLLLCFRRLLWPRWPLWMFVGAGALSLLGAHHFRAALWENAQLVLTCLAGYWLAGALVADEDQAKRLGGFLGLLTLALLLLAGIHYYRYIIRPPGAEELPTYVRATCASRAAYSGLMAMLLAMLMGRVIGSGDPLESFAWAILVALGSATLMCGGAVIALAIAILMMAAVRGRASLALWTVLVLAVVLGGGSFVSKRHLAHLGESLSFHRLQDGRPTAVEKRYLEMAAALNALGASRDVLPPGEPEEGAEGVEPVGVRPNVLFGVGAGLNYQKSIGQYYLSLDNPEKQEPDTYNLYLLLAVQLGLFGALAWAWILIDGMALARRAYEAHTDGELRGLSLGVYGVCVVVLVYSLFGTVLLRGTGLMLFTLLALGARLENLVRPSRPQPTRKRGATPEAEPAPSPPETATPPVAPPEADQPVRRSVRREVPSVDAEGRASVEEPQASGKRGESDEDRELAQWLAEVEREAEAQAGPAKPRPEPEDPSDLSWAAELEAEEPDDEEAPDPPEGDSRSQ